MQNGQETYKKIESFISREKYMLIEKENNELSENVSVLTSELLAYKQELAQLKRMIFGSKSKRHIGNDPSQLNLGLDVEPLEQPEKETEQITYSGNKIDNKKGSAVRLSLPSHLHREEHIIEPVEDVTGARKIGEVVTEVLEYTPGKFYFERYVRPKYVLPREERIVIGDFPSFPIPRGNARSWSFDSSPYQQVC
jgi:transposase